MRAAQKTPKRCSCCTARLFLLGSSLANYDNGVRHEPLTTHKHFHVSLHCAVCSFQPKQERTLLVLTESFLSTSFPPIVECPPTCREHGQAVLVAAGAWEYSWRAVDIEQRVLVRACVSWQRCVDQNRHDAVSHAATLVNKLKAAPSLNRAWNNF